MTDNETMLPAENDEHRDDAKDAKDAKDGAPAWNLRLYVAGQTPKSLEAFANLKRICEEHLKGCYAIEVIDLQENPHLARQDQIIAIPTLIRKLPEPIKKIIGTLANTERVLVGLDIQARSDTTS